MRRFAASLLAAGVILLLAPPALPAPRHAPVTPPFQSAHDIRLTHLLGMTVEDPNAQELGTVRDFVLDRTSGRIEYAVVGSGGFLGLGVHTRLLPISALSAETIIRGILSTTVSKAQWGNYPPFGGNVAALSDAESASQTAPLRPRSSPNSASPALPSAFRTDRPGGNRSDNQNRRLELASKLLDHTVVDRQHQVLGDISDLFLDLERQKPVLAVVRAREFGHLPETLAVPLPLLLALSDDRVVLEASPSRLESAPLFSYQAWGAAQGGTTIYRVPSSTET